ncbi:GNAT family N-acetyltransferase [Streptomyces millisiae]|uniref:GNAT family N-acetyltransferase n=1 Tax=Streptomyces millisiae TaxID=3075542 RepID=A0ABU2LI63_9ACTN|nr:GNAT family N-acetyltransferase [Streptomyces sp. DSM 44918]MDT0317279.1 GNAT family N-acetyltransferase [Streptomyces sp. DSM 44918]
MTPVVLEAGRLRLRPFTEGDVDWVHRVSLDPALQRFIDLPAPYRRADAEHFVRRLAVDGWAAGSRAEFLVEDAATADRLGRVGLHLRGDGTAEIGFWVAPAARGRGVAPTAAAAACRWGFADLGLALVEWRAEVGNDASRRVAEKVGFRVEATLRKRLRHRGERVDAWVGSLLPDELGRG